MLCGHASTCAVQASAAAAAQHRPKQYVWKWGLYCAGETKQHICGIHSLTQHLAPQASATHGSFTAVAVICRDAPRPMWARKSPSPTTQQHAAGGGSAKSAMITRQIVDCGTLIDLSDVYNEWGSSFDSVNAAAALVKYSKLSRKGSSSQLLQRLLRVWMQCLPDASARGCANVLWAIGNLGQQQTKQHSDQLQQQLHRAWGSTWDEFVQHVQRDVVRGAGDAFIPQHISSGLWAAAKLRRQPGPEDLQVLVQAFIQPGVLADADPQAISNIAWSVGELYQLPGWQGGVSAQDLEVLLGEQQLQSLAAAGSEQGIANVLLALAYLSTGPQPLISRSLAQDIGNRVLEQAVTPVARWVPQHITNTMLACGKLGLVNATFVAAAIAAARRWVPRSTGYNPTQAAQACVQLQLQDAAFMQMLLNQGLFLLQNKQQQQQQQQQQGQPRHPAGKPLSRIDKDALATLCSWAVSELDMQQLARVARDMVACSGVKHVRHPSSLRKLWVFHSWLLQHQLLDGKGLSELMTANQLRQGKQEAAVYGHGINVQPAK